MSNSYWDGISMPYSASGISRRLYAPAATLSNSQPTQTAQGAQRLCLIPNFCMDPKNLNKTRLSNIQTELIFSLPVPL